MSYEQPAPPAPPAGASGQDVPLWAPLYGASFGAAVKRFFTKYSDFSGRASRSEYWWWILFAFIVGVVIEGLGLALGFAGGTTNADGTASPGPIFWVAGVLALVWVLATIVPHLALIWRRLHDANLAGPFFFLSFVPFGSLVVLVFTLLPSKPEGARFDRPRA